VSALGKLVAVRSLDGTVLKGRTADFKPACTWFHVVTEDGSTTRVEVQGLKAVFFIKSFEGDPAHEEKKDFEDTKGTEKPVWIEFVDGEKLAGRSSGFASGKAGFFFTPTDGDSNMERAYVYRAAIRTMSQGPDAVQASEAHQQDPSAGRQPSGIGDVWRVD
jgi:hypothetical protein